MVNDKERAERTDETATWAQEIRMVAGAGTGWSGVVADLRAWGGVLPRRARRVFPLDGTLPGSDSSLMAAQPTHPRNGSGGLQD